MRLTALTPLAAFVLLIAPTHTQTAPLVAAGVIALPGVTGRIDHLAFDASTGRLFVAALERDSVEVVDTATNTHLRSLPGFREPQGIAIVPDANGIAVANGETGTLQLIDSQSLRVRWTTEIGGDADNVRYDAASRRVIVAAVGGLFSVDPASGKVINRVAINGHPESFQLEIDGTRAYANLPGMFSSKIVAADRASARVIATWDAGCGSNYPMALDESTSRLFVGCRRPASVALVDTRSGRTIVTTPTVGDADDLFYDAARRRVYVIGGEGAVDVLVRDADTLRSVARVPTRTGARTGLWVAASSRLYVAVPSSNGAAAEVRAFDAR